MRRIFQFIFLLLIPITGVFAASQIQSLDEFEEEWEKADENTLVIFDIDEVLITTEDHFMHPYASDSFHKALKKVGEKYTPEEFEGKVSLILLLPRRVLIEEGSPKLIRSLQERGVKVVALTSCPTGSFGVIPKVEHWRIAHLASLGIDFSTSYPHIGTTLFTDLQTLKKSAPIFEKGILFSYGYKKGEVLKAFLKKNRLAPSKIIFFDDLAENLASVEEELKALAIPFQVVHYRGAERFFKKLDENTIEHQLEHLMEKEEWLKDDAPLMRSPR